MSDQQRTTDRGMRPGALRAPRALCRLIVGALALAALTAPAAAESFQSVTEWESQLDRAGAAPDYERAAEVIVGPSIASGKDDLKADVSAFLRKAFGDEGFKADTISVLSSAERGERRLLTLFSGNDYAFLFVVLHKREDGWRVVNFSLEPNYGAIREQF